MIELMMMQMSSFDINVEILDQLFIITSSILKVVIDHHNNRL